MARTKGKDNRGVEEKKAAQELEQLKKRIGDKEPTEAQTKELKALNETLKTFKFKRIATQRVTKAVKAIEGIGKLAGPGYVKTQNQIDNIAQILGEAVNDMISKFTPGTKKEEKKIEI